METGERLRQEDQAEEVQPDNFNIVKSMHPVACTFQVAFKAVAVLT